VPELVVGELHAGEVCRVVEALIWVQRDEMPEEDRPTPQFRVGVVHDLGPELVQPDET
jgi:hypothetical protein